MIFKFREIERKVLSEKGPFSLNLVIDVAEFFRGENSFPTELNERGESLRNLVKNN
jgi:hypothetical protein